jgi:hypothetical protein
MCFSERFALCQQTPKARADFIQGIVFARKRIEQNGILTNHRKQDVSRNVQVGIES